LFFSIPLDLSNEPTKPIRAKKLPRMIGLGRLRILSVDAIPDTRRCAMVLMVLEGTLEVGASIGYRSRYLRVMALAKPGYRRRQAEEVTSEDLLSQASEGETVEAIVDVAPFDSPFADLLYHDLDFE
jgi:hypothetical protein